MFPAQTPRPDPGQVLRCTDSSRSNVDERKFSNKNSKADTALAHEVDRALWQDAAFRAIDYDNVEVRVRDGIVHLYGHLSSLANQNQAERLLREIPGLTGVENCLIPDDRLLMNVAAALGRLESAYDCKFFTGVSHGVVLLSGNAADPKVKLLAERCAAAIPNIRGVINSVRVRGSVSEGQDQPFLQPSIGVDIFFRDGVSGKVRKVIINPDNRLVVAMVVEGQFAGQRQELKSSNPGEARSPERQIVLSMDSVRYLTKVSGFLYIQSEERDRYADLDPALFLNPPKDWKAPYPYCPEDVLFAVEPQGRENQVAQQVPASQFAVAVKAPSVNEQPVNDSLGG